MTDKLKSIVPPVLPATNTPTTINLPGDGHTLIAHADSVQQSVSLIVMSGTQHLNSGNVAGTLQAFNCEYYNLFVIGGELFDRDHFLVPKNRALTESTMQEVKDSLASLSPEAVTKIKTYPALFVSENLYYGRTNEEQYARYGIVTDIKIQDNGIKVYFGTLNFIPQQRINELAMELGLCQASSLNELNRTHWAIKKINLVEALRDAGISVFALT